MTDVSTLDFFSVLFGFPTLKSKPIEPFVFSAYVVVVFCLIFSSFFLVKLLCVIYSTLVSILQMFSLTSCEAEYWMFRQVTITTWNKSKRKTHIFVAERIYTLHFRPLLIHSFSKSLYLLFFWFCTQHFPGAYKMQMTVHTVFCHCWLKVCFAYTWNNNKCTNEKEMKSAFRLHFKSNETRYAQEEAAAAAAVTAAGCYKQQQH